MDPSEWGNQGNWEFSNDEAWNQPFRFTTLLTQGMNAMSVNNVSDTQIPNWETGMGSNQNQSWEGVPESTWRASSSGHDEQGRQQEEEYDETEEEYDETEEVHNIIFSDSFNVHWAGVHGTMVGLQGLASTNQRKPYHTSILTGWGHVQELLNGHPKRCEAFLKMPKEIFLELCNKLVTQYGWVAHKENAIPVEESLAIFICVLRGHIVTDIDDRFQHSRSIVSRHVHKILKCMEGFMKDEIRPMSDDATVAAHLSSRSQYQYFQGCIGAIDGTHVQCNPKPSDAPLYFGRKGGYTMNIMAACDFNLCFTFASAGWEGTQHGYAIFREVTNNDRHCFPHPPPGTYYLVDAGYPNARGYLAPYKGYKYHQADFRRGKRPIQSADEAFNKVHSSLRSCIERAFGAWKRRWRFLRNYPEYSVTTQSKLVCASMAIHNFIRRRCHEDDTEFDHVDWRNEHYVFEDLDDLDCSQADSEDRNPQEWDAHYDGDWNGFRDALRDVLWEEPMSQARGRPQRRRPVT